VEPERRHGVSPGMLDWLTSHGGLVQAATSIVTAMVWVVYLQILVTGHRRQRRPEILISIGAGKGLSARCFVSNLGFEPIYINDVLLTLENGDAQTANITDRSELSDDELRNPAEATNQGPLKSGDFLDIGSYRQLINRVRTFGSDQEMAGDLSQIMLTVVGITAAEANLIAAKRSFRVEWREDSAILRATSINAEQIRGWRARRRIRRHLEAEL
jgi:hypothetical protein